MTKKQHYKRNLQLALPVMAGQMGHVLVGVVDSMMVGQLGPVPLAASALANSIFYIPMVFGMGLSFGITPLVANADGGKNTTRIEQLLKNGLLVNTLTGLLIFLITSAFAFWGLDHLGQPTEVVGEARNYLYIITASVIPFSIFFNFKQFAEGLSNTKAAMAITLGANAINVLFNYLLIYGNWGFPEMGIVGAGVATLIARVVMALSMAAYVYLHKPYHQYRSGFLPRNYSLANIKEILRVGVPTGLQYIFEVSAFAIAAIVVGTMGAKPLAAHQIAISLASISYMAASGLGAAATVRVGNQMGQQDYRNMRTAATTILQMALAVMCLAGLFFLAGRFLLPTFYTTDAEVIAIAAQLLIIATLFQLSDGAQVVLLGALRGLHDVKWPTFITFLAYWAVALPLAFVLGKTLNMGTWGVWIGLGIGLTLSASLLYWRFNTKSRQLITDHERLQTPVI